jgi:hypothetical protein
VAFQRRMKAYKKIDAVTEIMIVLTTVLEERVLKKCAEMTTQICKLELRMRVHFTSMILH